MKPIEPIQEQPEITIQQTGYTYIFQIAAIVREEDRQREEDRIRQGIQDGILVIDNRVRLISVEPQIKALVQQGKSMVKTWGLRGIFKKIK